MNLTLRRGVVVGAVVLSVILGAFSIEAAAAWTRGNAPLPPPPVSAASLAAQLDAEKVRSASLEQQLTDLTTRAGQLGTALDEARGRISTDASTAQQLKSALAAAQARIAAVTKQLAAYQAGPATTIFVGGGTAPASRPAQPPTTAPTPTGEVDDGY